MSRLAADFDGDKEFFKEMCKEFEEHLPARGVEMQDAFDAKDKTKLTGWAHNLKGISANFGADRLSSLAAELEICAEEEDEEKKCKLVAEVLKEINAVLKFLSADEFLSEME